VEIGSSEVDGAISATGHAPRATCDPPAVAPSTKQPPAKSKPRLHSWQFDVLMLLAVSFPASLLF